MKRAIIALLLLTGAALGVAAQDKKTIDSAQVPAVVKTTFHTTFPGSSNTEWKMKDNKYMVAFKINSTDHYAKLDSTGKIISRGMEIPASQLPGAVATAVKRDYPDYKIDKAFTVMEDGTTNYKVSFQGKEDRKIVYDAAGTRLKE